MSAASPRRPAARRRGLALMLVLAVVAVAVIVGLSFLSAQSTASDTARSVLRYAQARQVAEAALQTALARMKEDTDWRDEYAEGVWADQISFAGGTVTLTAEDGLDSDGDGVIEGDGDFADNASDPVTLTATALFQGRTRTLQAIFLPGGQTFTAVSEKMEVKDNALIDSYNSAAGLYGPSNQGERASIACNETGKANILLKDKALISGDLYIGPGGDPAQNVQISGTAQVTGTQAALPDYLVWPELIEPVIADYRGDVKYDKDYHLITSDLYCNKLDIIGSAVLKIDGDVTFLCEGDVNISDSARIVLANPLFGNDTLFDKQDRINLAKVQVATPITLAQDVTATSLAVYGRKGGAKLRLAIYSDQGGQPFERLVETGVETTTVDQWMWHEVTIPPTDLPAGDYWLAFSTDKTDFRYQFTESGTTHIRNYNAIDNSFAAAWGTSNAQWATSFNIVLSANVPGQGGSLRIYSKKGLTVQKLVQLNANTRQPERLRFEHASDVMVEFKGDAVAYATAYAPDALWKLRERTQYTGRLWTQKLLMEDQAQVHVDASGGTGDPGLLADETAEVKKDAVIDTHGGTVALVSNSAGTPPIKLDKNAIVKGDAYAGPAGNAGAIQIRGNAQLTGQRLSLAEAVEIPELTEPVMLGSPQDEKFSGSTLTVISQDLYCKKFTIEKNAIVEIAGNVTILATDEVRVKESGQLRLQPGASLLIYARKRIFMEHDAQFNTDGDPNAVTLYYAGTETIEWKNRAKVWGHFIAPFANEVKLKDDTQVFGSIRGKKLKLEQRAQIHQPEATSSAVRWIE